MAFLLIKVRSRLRKQGGWPPSSPENRVPRGSSGALPRGRGPGQGAVPGRARERRVAEERARGPAARAEACLLPGPSCARLPARTVARAPKWAAAWAVVFSAILLSLGAEC